MYTLMLEVSKHYEAGALKYSENNWKKGLPLHCYIDSGVRHFFKYMRGIQMSLTIELLEHAGGYLDENQ